MKNHKNIPLLLPTIGIVIFIGLFIYTASLYPGGSQLDPESVGFDWQRNYWCNLMSEEALNGEINPARPVALTAMVLLCVSMAYFFFLFAEYYEQHLKWRRAIKISGITGMLSAIFIFTSWHDVMTTLLSVAGIVVIIGMIRALYRNKYIPFMIAGIGCMIVIGINNWFYYDERFLAYSPLVQKTAFVLILGWTIALNLNMKRVSLKQ